MRGFELVIGAMLIGTLGCGGSSGNREAPDASSLPEKTATAADRCASQGSDSTRAACLAFDTLMRLGHPPRTLHLVQRGKTFCVHTVPGRRPTADGESVVEVRENRVTRVTLSDSTGCGTP